MITPQPSDLIAEFLARYRKEYDFYDQAARLVAQTLEASLQSAGIRSIVTARAKNPKRLEVKCRQRALTKDYASVADIFADIHDLAGARVALYFPGEREQVDKVIVGQFVVLEKKTFPDQSTPNPSYAKRFSGYWATHYRVQLREAPLNEVQKRYAEARVEIQVASALMHAWSEVDHDLVYKPLSGLLSDDEYAILDELNGLVLTGEIALERLQRAGEARIAAGNRQFLNHYDLASHVLGRASALLQGPLQESALGRIDLLYELLKQLNLTTPEKLNPYLEDLHGDTERRPVADQIIDRLLVEDESRYETYEAIRAADQVPPSWESAYALLPSQEATTGAIGEFISQWIVFERLLRQSGPTQGSRSTFPIPTVRAIGELDLSDDDRLELERIRRLRNNLVHGIETPHPADLQEAARRLKALNARLTKRARSRGRRFKNLP
jgi:ppGpp synthetase/RelA/SpoT-type nucleotidyltranferase